MKSFCLLWFPLGIKMMLEFIKIWDFLERSGGYAPEQPMYYKFSTMDFEEKN